MYFLPVRVGNLKYYDARVDTPARQIYNETLSLVKQKSISPPEARARIERDIVAVYVQRQAKFEEIASTLPEPHPDFDRLLNYTRLRRQGWSLMAEAFTHWDPRTKQMADEKFQDADAIVEEGEEGNGQPDD